MMLILRSHYCNHHTGREWGNMANYERMLDFSELGIAGTADLLAEYVKRRTE